LADATERLRTARARLARARTPDEYAGVSRTAVEGLRQVRAARAALGMDTGPGPTGGTYPEGQAGETAVSPVRTAISRPLDQVGQGRSPVPDSRDGVNSAAGASTRLFAAGGLPPASY
jgi:hypothetical protein